MRRIEESCKYYSRAAKFFDCEEVLLNNDGQKFNWLLDNLTGSIMDGMQRLVNSCCQEDNNDHFGVMPLKTSQGYSALLIKLGKETLQVIHVDSDGILLTDKPNLVGVVGEIIGQIPVSIVDIAHKQKDGAVEKKLQIFEEMLSKLIDHNCSFNDFNRESLQSLLINHLEEKFEEVIISGETNQIVESYVQ